MIPHHSQAVAMADIAAQRATDARVTQLAARIQQAQQMQQLEQAGGAEFDRMFLQMMVEHHNGAVAMAHTELAEGQNPEGEALAQKIIDDQRAEIREMQTLSSMI